MGRLLAMTVILGGTAVSASAQQRGDDGQGGPKGPQGSQWSLGIGLMSKQDVYKGIKRDTQAVPLLRFENEYLLFSGLGVEAKLPSLKLSAGSQVKFGLLAKSDMSGYDDDDIKKTPILVGMTERKGGLWAGAKAKWETDFMSISAEMTADASGDSKGRKFSLGLEKGLHVGQNTMLIPYVTAHRVDDKYVDYYYGVRAAEAAVGRAAYTGKGGLNLDVGLRAIHRFDNHHSMLLSAGTTRLAKEIKASPIVGRGNTNQVILGYAYNFR